MSSRRNTELWLLIAATPVLFLLFLMLLVNDGTELSVEAFAVPLGLAASFFVAHIVARKFAPDSDPAILPIVYLIAGIGICFVLRLAPDAAMGQVVFLFIGVVLMSLTMALVRSIEKLARYRYICLIIAVFLLLSPMLPIIGKSYNGSRIWLSIAGFSFQPGEVAKVFIILFLASYMASHREMLSTFHKTRIHLPLPDFKTLLPLIGMWAVTMLVIVLEKDLGSALLLYGIFLAMLYVCTGRISFVILGILLFAVGGTGLYMVFDHVQVRIAIWQDPFAYAHDQGYQLVQSLYSLADGGLFGSGIGRGLTKAVALPEVESDFVFSAIGEEMGLLGASGLIILYLLLAVRGFATAARAKSDVAAFVAAGLATSLSLQAFIIVGGVTGFIPLTGITLPFVSKGGSSLLASFIMVGLLLSAGNEGTGLTSEMTATLQVDKIKAAVNESSVLGRAALGKRLTRLIALIVVLFAALIANLTYIQVVEAESLQSREDNNHTMMRVADHERGKIMTADGAILAKSEEVNGTYKRIYPKGKLAANVVGYYSPSYGSTGMESTMATTLVGEQGFDSIMDVVRSSAGLDNPGNDVVLTLDADIQAKAEEVLQGSVGACVVLDTESGAILAEASAPTYDPNNVQGILDGSVTVENSPLVNRATGALYEPGSTFKTVTLAAALDSGFADADTIVDSPSSKKIGGAKVTTHRDSGKITLQQAMAISSNTAFAQLAVDMGGDVLVSYAEKFGLNSDIAQDFPLAQSIIPDADEMTTHQLAWAGAGEDQNDGRGPEVTVVQMATIMAAISNDGEVMRPYLISEVRSNAGATISETSPESMGSAMSASAAKEQQDIMETVVTSGTGTAARISGATVIGKTGTAESGNKNTAWFIGTATRNGKSVTVAVCIEGTSEEGGTVAAPKARQVLEVALSEMGA